MNGESREERVLWTYPCGCRQWWLQTFTSAGEPVEDELLREEFCPEGMALVENAARLELDANPTWPQRRPPSRSPEEKAERKQHIAKLIMARGEEAVHPSLSAGMPTIERVEEIDEEGGS